MLGTNEKKCKNWTLNVKCLAQFADQSPPTKNGYRAEEKKLDQSEWVFSATVCFWRGELILIICRVALASFVYRGNWVRSDAISTTNSQQFRMKRTEKKRHAKKLFPKVCFVCCFISFFFFVCWFYFHSALCCCSLVRRVCVYVLVLYIYRLSFAFFSFSPCVEQNSYLMCMAEIYTIWQLVWSATM